MCKSREHLFVALRDHGVHEIDARDLADDTFDAENPRQHFRNVVDDAMTDLDREAIRVNALRAVRDKWIA